MTKKIKIFSLFLVVVLALSFLLTSCGKNTWGPVEIAEGEAKNNGGMVVEKGDYYYFVNGFNSAEDDNTFGTPVQGSICRIKKDNTGFEIVVPKIVYSSMTVGGIFIFGDYVYYATPNSEKDKTGKVQNSFLDFNCSKLDGSSTEKLFTIDTISTGYRFVEVDGKVILNYVSKDSIKAVDVTEGKLGKEETIVKNITSACFEDNGYIYYAKTLYVDDDSSKSAYSYNAVYRASADGKENDKLFEDGGDLTSTVFNVVQAYKDALYLTKTINGVDRGLYVIKTTGTVAEQIASIKQLTEKAPSDFVPYDYDNGIILIENALGKIVSSTTSSRIIISPTEKSYNVLVVEDGYLYMTSSENNTDPQVEVEDDGNDKSVYIYRVKVPSIQDKKLSDNDINNNLYMTKKVDLSYKGIEFVSGNVFFLAKDTDVEGSVGSYLYVIDADGNLKSLNK